MELLQKHRADCMAGLGELGEGGRGRVEFRIDGVLSCVTGKVL